MRSAFSFSSIQSGFVSHKLLHFFISMSSCLYFTQQHAFHLLMDLGNEQLNEKLLWRVLLDSERRPFHLRGRSQESLRFVTLHSPRVCARDRQRESERGGGEGKQTGGCEEGFFIFWKWWGRQSSWSLERQARRADGGTRGLVLKKRKGKIYSTITATAKASTGPSGLQIPACLRLASGGTVISSFIKDMSSFFSLNNILQSLSEHLCVLSGTKKYLDT